jgi:hypothetical protein
MKGVLPHSTKLGREKRYDKMESMPKITQVRKMLKSGFRLWQIREYQTTGRLLLSIREIAQRLKSRDGMVRYRLPFLMKPQLNKEESLILGFHKGTENAF